MSKLELLQIAHESQRDRLNSELSLFWNRISVLSVAIVGIAYAAGALLLAEDNRGKGLYGMEETSLLVFLGTCVIGFALSWTLCGAIISGMYWVRINEKKLEMIEASLFGFTIYGFSAVTVTDPDETLGIRVDEARMRTSPVTSFWKMLALLLVSMSVLGMVSALAQFVMPLSACAGRSGQGGRFVFSLVISFLCCWVFWHAYFVPQAKRVWASAILHTGNFEMFSKESMEKFHDGLNAMPQRYSVMRSSACQKTRRRGRRL